MNGLMSGPLLSPGDLVTIAGGRAAGEWLVIGSVSEPRIEEWGSAPAPRPPIVNSQAEAEAQGGGWTVVPSQTAAANHKANWPTTIQELTESRARFGATEPWQFVCMVHGIFDRRKGYCPDCEMPTNAHTKPQVMHKRPFGDDPGPNWQGWQELTQKQPEIPVTDEMLKRAEWLGGRLECTADDVIVTYKALAALAPKPPAMAWLKDMATGVMTPVYPERERIADLEATNTLALSKIAELEPRILHLEAERAAWKHLYEATQFGDPTTPDLPDPPRRPDGTLAPQPKPLPVLKTQEPSRRVGG